VRNLYSMFRAMFADAHADERVDRSPCRLRRGDLPASRDRDPRWRARALFDRDEVVALITDSRIPVDRRTLYAVAFLSASRSGELSALRVCDYDRAARPLRRLIIGDSYSIHLRRPKATKTGVTRLVPVHPVLQSILDEWLAHGFHEVFGCEPRANDLMFPSRPSDQGIDYRAVWADQPSLTRAELARHLGVSRAAVTQALRRAQRRVQDPSTSFRTPKSNYKSLQEDLRQLGFRRRRLHDAKRTAVSLLTEDGVRDPILTYLAWGPRNNVRDLYITLPWDVFCQEMLKLKLPL
jgi:integrase